MPWDIVSMHDSHKSLLQTIFLLCLTSSCLLGMKETETPEVKTASYSAKIIGGKESTVGAYPWMGVLVFSDASDNYNGHFCGASLIHPRYAITAAHCVEDLEPEDLYLILGLHNLDDQEFDAFAIIDIIIHPNWDPYFSDSDIALLVLDRAAEGYESLPLVHSESDLDDVGNLATAMGWGATNSSQTAFPIELREVDLPILANSTVNAAASYNGDITENMLSAGYMSGGLDSCVGDSGGPLFVRDAAGAPYLAGIVSFGEGCAEPNFPGIYTRVANFRNWVFSYIQPNYYKWEVINELTAEWENQDNDSQNNFAEYAFGSDPQNSNSLPATAHSFTEIDSEQFFTLDFMMPRVADGIEYTVQASNDLSNWDNLNMDLLTVPSNVTETDELTSVAVRYDSPLSSTNQTFLRVEAGVSEKFIPADYTLSPSQNRRSALHISDATADDFYYKDFYISDTETGTTYEISTYSSQINSYLELYDADTNVLLASDNNDGFGLEAKIILTPTPGRDYFVR